MRDGHRRSDRLGSSTLSWRLPSPEPRLAARRYLVRRRDCLQPEVLRIRDPADKIAAER